MDIFNEYIIERKKGPKELLLIAGMFLGAILLLLLVLVFAQYLLQFALLVVAGIIYLLYFGITSLSIEYEYTVTNGEIDIDRISAKRKRKRMLSVHARSFDYFAPLTGEHRQAFEDGGIVKRFDFTSNTRADNVYFAVFTKSSQKTCITFEPTSRMIEDFSRHVPRRVFFTL